MPGAARNHPSLLAAALFVGAGSLALWECWSLEVGDLAGMGPGYMPRALAILLIAIGLGAAVRGMLGHVEALGQVRLRPVVAIFAAVAGFAVLSVQGGLVLAAAWLLAVASLATPHWRTKEVLISAAVLIPLTTLVFVIGLGLQIKIWPW